MEGAWLVLCTDANMEHSSFEFKPSAHLKISYCAKLQRCPSCVIFPEDLELYLLVLQSSLPTLTILNGQAAIRHDS